MRCGDIAEAGHAIGAVIPPECRTDIARRPDQAGARIHRAGADRAVRQHAVATGSEIGDDLPCRRRGIDITAGRGIALVDGTRQLHLTRRLQHGVADQAGPAPAGIGLLLRRNREVAGIAVEPVQMPGEAAMAAVQPRERGRPGIVAPGDLGPAAGTAIGAHGRNASVRDIDRAADRAAAIEQRRGALQHGDAVDQERLDRSGMVAGRPGCVLHRQAVDQYGDAIARQAADFRTARARPEIAVLDAGEMCQRCAQARRLGFVQFEPADVARRRGRQVVRPQRFGARGGDQNVRRAGAGRRRACGLGLLGTSGRAHGDGGGRRHEGCNDTQWFPLFDGATPMRCYNVCFKDGSCDRAGMRVARSLATG